MNFEKGVPEKEIAEKELSVEEKKDLSQFWCEAVLGAQNPPAGVEKMSNKQIKEWLSKSLSQEMVLIAKQFGFEPDKEFIKVVRTEKDSNKRAALEMQYIERYHDLVDKKVQEGYKGTRAKWASWPLRIREEERFNCVGGTLIGSYLLDKAGIENYCGHTSFHVVNIVRLSNNEWWYVDFVNGKKFVRKIEPEIIKLDNITVLKFKDALIDFRIVPLLSEKEMVAPILENITMLKDVAEGSKEYDKDEWDKDGAMSFMQKFKSQLIKFDLEKILEKLFPEIIGLSHAQEMVADRQRLIGLEKIFKKGQDFFKKKGLNREQIIALLTKMKENINEVQEFFYKNNNKAIQKMDKTSQEMLKIYKREVDGIKLSDEQLAQDFIEIFIGKITQLF